MGHGAVTRYLATMLSGGTVTSSLDLSRSWFNVYLAVPSMSTNTQIMIQGSAENTIFRRITQPVLNTTTAAAPPDFAIVSSVTNRLVPIPNGIRYIKIETTDTVAHGQTFTVICSDDG